MEDEIKAVRKELEKTIIEKVDLIKEKILTGQSAGFGVNGQLEMLSMVNDELSDVLLNWEPRFLDGDVGRGSM